MNDNSDYEKELLKKIKDIEIALRYYIDINKELETDLEYYKNAYENRVDDFINRDRKWKDKINKKIEKLKKRYTENSYFKYDKNEVTDICIEQLQELLKGGELNV